MRSKKGSQFIEASLIYPIIIVISVVSILLMVFFYSCLETAAVMSMDIRALSGESAGTVRRVPEDSGSGADRKSTLSYDIQEERGLLYSEFAASCRASFKADGWFCISGVKEFSARRSCVNEAERIWQRQTAGEMIGDDKGEE